MGEIVAFGDFRKSAARSDVVAVFENRSASRQCAPAMALSFPTARPGISGNLCDLFEQANAVVMRHYEGDPRVPRAVAETCIELLQVLSVHAEPE